MNNEFKAGDLVERFTDPCHSVMVGDVDKIVEITSKSYARLEGRGDYHFLLKKFRLVESGDPHPHMQKIIAWAKGAKIKCDAVYMTNPSWRKDCHFELSYPSEKSPAQIERDSIVEEMVRLQARLDKLEVE